MYHSPKQLKQVKRLKSCRHNQGKTRKAYGCGGAFEESYKCDLHGECVLFKVCKKPDEVLVCEKCEDWEK